MDADALAKVLWDYNLMHQELVKSDAIIALGSHDIRVGEYAAELFLKGWAPLLICSGGIGRLTEEWPKAEADLFAQAAIKLGVPEEKIIIENKSTNSAENIRFTKALIEAKGVELKQFWYRNRIWNAEL